jgi:hypothetical protein
MLDEQMTSPETPAPEAPATVEKLFTDEQFAHLGGGTLAYVKTMMSDDVKRIYPQAPDMPSSVRVFALIGADGIPLILSDSRDMAVANALENKLEIMSVH